MDNLIIKKGGFLTKGKWDKELEDYIPIDITDDLPLHLFDPCELEEGVTLRDIFLLSQKHIDILRVIINNWIEELIDEGLNKKPERTSEIDSLELYYHIDDFGGIGGFSFPAFHGLSQVKEDDEFYKKGETVQWGVDFSAANELIDLPINLKNTVILYDENFKVKEELKDPDYTLGGIIYGIFWELSFYGPPDKRKTKREEIFETIKNIKEEDCIPMDDELWDAMSNIIEE